MMQIEEKKIPVRDLIADYENDPDKGVHGYGGRLDIRPPYQREFRYNDKQKQDVIKTILKQYPLNIMYWSDLGNDEYEMIDGQQRTLSICEYHQHDFNIKDENGQTLYFSSLTPEEKEAFLNYELTVYFCKGTTKEKLEWFRVINIAGERLLDQELLNAIYVGPFVTDARRYFSKDKCPAFKLADNLLSGVARNQDYLATVLHWAARREGIKEVSEYMSKHKDDANANQLWAYFSAIVTWVRSTFIKYRKEMKGLDWGFLYDNYHENIYDTAHLEQRIHDLMEDDEIMKKSGIYSYVLSDDLRDLSFRTFDKKQKREAYERQQGICPHWAQLVADAVDRGAKHIMVGLGGSATSDAGMGMLRALPKGREGLQGVRFTIATDVTNPLCGPNGAARVFAPQKGATPEMVEELELRARCFAEESARRMGFDRSEMAGAGAAGGLGYAFLQFLDAECRSGAELLLELAGFREKICGADLIITGEGHADSQTLMGKLPMGILQQSGGVAVALMAGQVDDVDLLRQAGFAAVVCINPPEVTKDVAMRPDVARDNIRKAMGELLPTLLF